MMSRDVKDELRDTYKHRQKYLSASSPLLSLTQKKFSGAEFWHYEMHIVMRCLLQCMVHVVIAVTCLRILLPSVFLFIT